ncbi:MAG: HisA/HisF-related TIM barrel protein [Candidatus Bathyarchaeota archaeon]
MKIIPVIDILNGIAVHGIRGERKRYNPLKSILFNYTNPIQIASAFENQGFNSLYIADLDAILKKSPSFDCYKQICRGTNLDLMVDAGISELSKAKELFDTGVSKIVIGTETLNSLDFVNQAIEIFGEERVLVSLDQKGGKIFTISESLSKLDILCAAKRLVNYGVKQIIILDLDRVGTEYGINQELLKKLLETVSIDILVGGGIRNLQELKNLEDLGIHGVLIATILHNGKLTIDELRSAGFL